MAKQFVPKTQSKVGQIVDSIFILVLVYVSLFILPRMRLKPAQSRHGILCTWRP